MSEIGAQLRRYLGAARVLGLRRATGGVVAEVLAIGVGTALLAGHGAGLTLRGDIFGPAALGLGLGLAAWATATGIRRARRAHGDALATARTVGLGRGPLDARAKTDASLRREILGAAELLEGVAHGDVAGSPALASHYVSQVENRLQRAGADPRLALGPRGAPWRLLVLTGLVVALWISRGATWFGPGLDRAMSAEDGRPEPPAAPLWNTLDVDLRYPAHTGRPPRAITNPSGALRVPAGTDITVSLTPEDAPEAMLLLLEHDAIEGREPPEPVRVELRADGEEGRFTGTFTARGAGSWVVLALDSADDDPSEARGRAPAQRLELEVDEPPEVELRPLPGWQKEVRDQDRVELRFVARDDFGLAAAELVYQLGDGTAHRIPAGKPPVGARNWRHRHSWDLSAIPTENREEVLYWLEIRDNDPGLGLVPLPDPPGKVTRSATMRLLVKDEEAEHSANIGSLRELRDQAIDLLAGRLSGELTVKGLAAEPEALAPALSVARTLHRNAAELLAGLSGLVDALAVDSMVRERDVRILDGVHERLLELHRAEMKLHEKLPPGVLQRDPRGTRAALDRLSRHNRLELEGLEDEIIRLDDLVDGQLLARLEALLARLQATQQKLVEVLEQLQAGDESVRNQVEQLMLRRADDLRRIQEVRSMLQKEVGREYMNLDAFELLQQAAAQDDMNARLQQGDVEGALQQAREGQSQMRGIQDAVQERLAVPGEGAMSQEEKQRIEMLRALSRLQDEVGSLRDTTKSAHESWRSGVADDPADGVEATSKAARDLGRRLDSINDARLGREARERLEDAREAVARLESLAKEPEPSALEAAELADEASVALEDALAGTPSGETEHREVTRAGRQAKRLRNRLRRPLRAFDQVVDGETVEGVDRTRVRQEGVRDRARALLDEEIAEILPPAGRAALRRAGSRLDDGSGALRERQTGDALREQGDAWKQIQRAIDSLRRSSASPPPSASGETSTEAEQDKSLRDELMETMRQGTPDGFGDQVKRYYEELLR